MDFVYFLGRFHVLVLHLPIGIILITLLLEWLARNPRYRHLDPAAGYLWVAAAVSAIVTAALGYMHFAEGGFLGPSANAHRLYGTSVAVVTTLIWLLRFQWPAIYKRVQTVAGVVLLVLLILAGHYGGNLTHGSSFLIAYAPGQTAELRLEASPVSAPRATAEPRQADLKIVQKLYAAGFLVRQVSQTDPLLVVSVYAPGAPIQAEQLAALMSAAELVTELDLQSSSIADRDLDGLQRFTELARLRLDNNDVTDAGVRLLAGLPRLSYLNLYGNSAVSDASVDALSDMTQLQRVYLWQTSVSEAGAERLRQRRPDLRVELATTARFVAEGQRAADQVGKN